jgi:hypothetical protein
MLSVCESSVILRTCSVVHAFVRETENLEGRVCMNKKCAVVYTV